jgi:hypothetical protein
MAKSDRSISELSLAPSEVNPKSHRGASIRRWVKLAPAGSSSHPCGPSLAPQSCPVGYFGRDLQTEADRGAQSQRRSRTTVESAYGRMDATAGPRAQA